MHIVDGDHGHTHGHTHEHTHKDGCTHTHAHEHAHGHEEDHDHTHEHEHEHCGSCGGCGGERPANEQEAILAYMLDHNKHHAAELQEVAKQFRTDGKEEAASQIEKAVECFEKGNLYLSVALSSVKAPQ